MLPFGEAKAIGVDQLLKLLKNEEVFDDARRAVLACKQFHSGDSIRNGVRSVTSRRSYKHGDATTQRLEIYLREAGQHRDGGQGCKP